MESPGPDPAPQISPGKGQKCHEGQEQQCSDTGWEQPGSVGFFTADLSFLTCCGGKLSVPARNRPGFIDGASWRGDSTPSLSWHGGGREGRVLPCPRWELEVEHGGNAAGSAGPGPGLAATSVRAPCAPGPAAPPEPGPSSQPVRSEPGPGTERWMRRSRHPPCGIRGHPSPRSLPGCAGWIPAIRA